MFVFIVNHFEIRDTKIGYINKNGFLIMRNNYHGGSNMVMKMIKNGLFNVASLLESIQSSELIMTIAQHYVLDESIVRSVIGEMVLNLRPKNIKKVFTF